ncbi:MAG: uracil-DNA glycosylase [Chloroflexi bacterium]|nr:uracil-DNA glycosylase [Chloroflexota bacterium]
MTPEERSRALEQIANEVRVCTRCRLHQGRTNAVPGEGHPETEVVFVGEGPGFNEDQQGRPFVGAAGNLLTELIGTVGWRRDEVFITNVVKCRPPGNRDPEPDEIQACRPYLRRQLEALDPALIVTLGRISLDTFMPGARIGAVHGTARPVDPGTGAATAMSYAMYHPAAAFRQQALRDTLFAEMTDVPATLVDARERRAESSVGTPVAAETTGTTSIPAESAAVAPGAQRPQGAQLAPGAPVAPGDHQLDLFR